MSGALGVQWKAASVWFAARPKREKFMLAGAALAVTWMLGDALWLTPGLRAYKTQQVSVTQKQTELSQLDAQRTSLKAAVQAREAELAQESERAKNDLAAVSSQLAEFEKTLVPARYMAEFLRGLLPASGAEIVSLRTLPPTPLIIRAKEKEGEVDKSQSQIDSSASNIYRHGVEVTLSGNYDALLAYLARLEQSPQKVLWGNLDLEVEKYPRSQMTLLLYTLSLDALWLEI